MKITDLITLLQSGLETLGDVDVIVDTSNGLFDVAEADVDGSDQGFIIWVGEEI